ncbi:uncharacterized protein SPAPADRAFT_55323 [Spathaspora passalidarum NRRL Y-27907]|uniref:Skg3/CAF120-like PH-like domain-containing protein n=1 Tax=Spathaspora passalidarum (strain NRRL Y-27907 / 11-Y1) TaxID=619300 RepID=G3AMK1_SPAPN|nr:uncharacterized protein SPAPADRAFT_55323 [Spathaspora passalidarum NRRL Y-27907]EGW33445.1 hypothetical protein SPAPADRAFT_55323 [Spathaspora passalidarum NRRL Y-27907]
MIKILNSNGTTPSGASKRTVSDKVKASPSFVRSSRIFEDGLNSSSPSLSGKTLLLENKAQIEALPKEFHPVLYLINAQKLRTYSTGTLEVLAEGSWVDVDARLIGNELTMWRNTESEEFKYINLIDYQLEVVNKLQIKLYQDFVEDSQVYIRFESQVEFNQWLSAIILSKFEYVKLNEAFTAVVLSSKASKLSDTHILMSKKRYSKSEFCNIRLPQISSKWLKVYMVIVPSDNKHLGRIEIYQDDKKVNKKHLIAYIANANHVFNVYPELPAMVDFNSIMNLKGEIHINKHFEHLFAHNNSIPIPKSDSSSSLLASPKMSHSRSTSVNSTSSFFGSPGTSPKPSSMMTFANRDRSSSNESKQSSKASEIVVEKELKEPKRTPSTFLKKHSNDFIMTDSIYIMPISHPGVSPIETMIRNFIPIIDSFKLYGRPQMLISDRKDANCLLFGLPSLPRYEYLSREHVEEAVAAHAGQEFDYEKIISDKIQQLQAKGYRGDGDISNLYNSLNSTSYDLAIP